MDHRVKYKTTRCLEQNIDDPQNLRLGQEFLDLLPKGQVTKAKTSKLSFNKIKNFAL